MNFQDFKNQQELYYGVAVNEIRSGRKQSHWIWFVFPQLRQLGTSYLSTHYGITDLDEAKEYLKDFTLSSRLIFISRLLLQTDSDNPVVVMGSKIDAMKLQSSMTLFHLADPENPVFIKVLERFYKGELDKTTCQLV